MEIITSIIIQAIALFISLLVTILRGWVRLGLEQRALTAPDYLVWCGWLCTLGWFICSIMALEIGRVHPVDPDTGATDSVAYLKFNVLRSLDKQSEASWDSVNASIVNWVLNISTDVARLAGIFSLGLITILVSTSRFIAYTVDHDLDDSTGNAWCTIEICTAVIVVSLPGLKSLFVKSKSPGNTSDRSNSRHKRTSLRQPSGHRSFTSRARVQEERHDDELELIPYGQNSALAIAQTPSEKRELDTDRAVVITTDFTVTRDSSSDRS
ncbi:hypothetical protein FHETE_11217 [Fusarium heterosporum]|uniref:Rhodopsin domain-containing protein n=1 Tax=Fusarium heterosporum TaxID=42747 RepID=A0A8H5WEB0_FUSHE|nr:hypothetical protein FHETE_11217 [Fusarium heterosporum]